MRTYLKIKIAIKISIKFVLINELYDITSREYILLF